MLIQASANEQLDGLMEVLCLELSLTDTQHERAARAYQSLGDWLSQPGTTLADFRPSVYPQGSLPLGTSVRPRTGDDFDADGVCLLTQNYGSLAPSTLYKMVLERIAEHGTYARKVTPRERCIRIDYEGNFHLDIVPAVPADLASSRILIPTKSQAEWQSSNPKGFESWFRSRESVRRFLGSIRADTEPMPAPVSPGRKPPLQRVAQLFKRRRAVFFENADTLAPKSILLTTLVAGNYTGEALITDATLQALSRIQAQLPPGSPPSIDNPSNPGENLARHWLENNRAYTEFHRFREDFQDQMAALVQLRGTANIADALRRLFDPDGSGVVDRAVAASTASFQQTRTTGQIGMAPRASSLVSSAAAGAVAIPKNTFFGDND